MLQTFFVISPLFLIILGAAVVQKFARVPHSWEKVLNAFALNVGLPALIFSPYIRVNAVAPGFVETALIKNVAKERIEEYWDYELIKDPITSHDIAQTVSFLLSDAAKYYTGAVFDINNGCNIR